MLKNENPRLCPIQAIIQDVNLLYVLISKTEEHIPHNRSRMPGLEPGKKQSGKYRLQRRPLIERDIHMDPFELVKSLKCLL